ncbi:MAG: diacylglycerol kinase [Bauldia sp.]
MRRRFGYLAAGGRVGVTGLAAGRRAARRRWRPRAALAAAMKNRPLFARATFAWAGLQAAWRAERSFRAEVTAALATAALLAWLQPGLLWCAAVAVAVVLVFTLELVNTALEALADHLHPDFAIAIRVAKDTASAAVMVAIAGAAVVLGLAVISALGP